MSRRTATTALTFALALGLSFGALAAEPVTITFMHWGTGESYIERNERLIQEFERLNPDIRVERIMGGSGQEYVETLLTQIAGGIAPDTFMVDLEYIPFFADVALDLWPFIEKDPDYGWDSIAAAARDIMMVDDKVVGTLDSVSPNIWYYNADMFDRAGLEYPTLSWQKGGWTWDEFRDASMKLFRTDADGNVLVWGNSAGTHQALPRLFMWSNGAAEYDDVRNPTRSLYDAPEAIEAIRFLQQMQVDDGIAYPYPGNPNGPFVSGQVAMMARWSSGIASFAQSADFRFGIAPYPIGPSENARYASDVGASIFAVSATTPHPEAAWRWVRFLGSREAAPIFSELGPGISIHPGIDVGFIPDHMIYPEVIFNLIDLPNNGNQVRLMAKDAGDINRIVEEGMAKILTGQVPAETGMREIASLVNTYLRNNPQ